MTATDASAPADGGLSIDEAVEMLTPRRDDDGFDASLAETEDGDEAAFDEGDTPDDEEGEGGYDPPHFWSAEDKAAFAELPPHLQETVLAYERNRDTAAARAIQAAAEARNRAEAAASGADEVVSRLDKLLPEAEAAFGQRWPDDMDWGALADEVGERERTERVVAAELHALVDRLGRRDPLLQRERRLVDHREQDPVHDEARRVLHVDRHLTEALGEAAQFGPAALPVVQRGLQGERDPVGGRVPGEVVRHDHQAAVTASLERRQLHPSFPSLAIVRTRFTPAS